MAEKKKAAQFIPMTSTQAAIGGGALIGSFALWFLWAAVGQSVICWIESHPATAAWIQALGSILAFGIALTVYVDELSKEEKMKIWLELNILFL